MLVDLPQRPRVERRRRGPDFFANFERALAPALAGCKLCFVTNPHNPTGHCMDAAEIEALGAADIVLVVTPGPE